ncbi:GM23205 [Drosophila sechellia]|uniref:GM23205 n=1 Tax=Drosophila sechellia TaxID=7238 RepID=B4IIE7_DROSE|nr:GM23205 [Drosophila sechellia]
MEKLTISHYLTLALKKLDPPSDWEDILEFVLATLDATCRPKYYTKELEKALNVGLRFGIIREMNNKYYLYEYAKINSLGKITYEFTENPLSPSRCINKDEEDDDDEQEDDEDEEEDDDDEEVDKKCLHQNYMDTD